MDDLSYEYADHMSDDGRLLTTGTLRVFILYLREVHASKLSFIDLICV